jgi:hypothetical protein
LEISVLLPLGSQAPRKHPWQNRINHRLTIPNDSPASVRPPIQRRFRRIIVGPCHVLATSRPALPLRIVDGFPLPKGKYLASHLRLFISGMPADGDA